MRRTFDELVAYLDTKAKLKPQQENADFYYALFSESGFDDKVLAESKSDPKLTLHSLEDIVGLVFYNH